MSFTGKWTSADCGAPGAVRPEAIMDAFLDGTSEFSVFREAVLVNEAAMLATMKRLLASRVALSAATRSRSAAAAVLFGGPELKKLVLEKMLPTMTVVEVVGLVRIVDAPRLRRQLLAKREALLAKKNPKPLRLRTLNSRIREVTDLLQEPHVREKENVEPNAEEDAERFIYRGSISGSVVKHLKRWARNIPAGELEFFMLNFGTGVGALPTKPWQDIADKAHFGPQDFAVPYFLHVTHGAAAPEDSLVRKVNEVQDVNDPSFEELFSEFPQLANCYSFLRKRFPGELPMGVVMRLIQSAPLEDVFWFYDEILSRSVERFKKKKKTVAMIEDIVRNRLETDEDLDVRGRGRANYGKLVQSLLSLRRRKVSFLPALMATCETELLRLKDKYGESDARIAVLGDCSGSMQVAVETATIVGSLLSSVLNAELVFFNDQLRMPDRQPASVDDVLHITETIRAERRTNPAAALAKYYNERRAVDLFVVVTDEVENSTVTVEVPTVVSTKGKGKGNKYKGRKNTTVMTNRSVYFAELFTLYVEHVNPAAKVFFVSFIDGPITRPGQMRQQLKARGVESREFRMALRMPDLTKLPQILALLSLDSLGIDDAGDIAEEAVTEVTAEVADGQVESEGAEKPESTEEEKDEAMREQVDAPVAKAQDDGWEVVA